MKRNMLKPWPLIIRSATDLPAILRRARIECEMTQMEVAADAGLSYQSVNEYENGRSVPTWNNFAALLKSLRLVAAVAPMQRHSGATQVAPPANPPISEAKPMAVKHLQRFHVYLDPEDKSWLQTVATCVTAEGHGRPSMGDITRVMLTTTRDPRAVAHFNAQEKAILSYALPGWKKVIGQ